MIVFKFGGASIKDAASVKNVAEILKLYPEEKILVVVSAMGKTTNALERLTDAFFYGKEDKKAIIEEIHAFHVKITNELFPSAAHSFHEILHNTLVEPEWAVDGTPEYGYDKVYDQVCSCGEVISTKIVSAFLAEKGISNSWLDVRDVIKTDETWREGKVNWELTQANCDAVLQPHFKNNNIIVTQGFIGGTLENYTTTLGREGSDYTAAILAWCMNAKSVTIWKDVPGVLNADPKWFDQTTLIERLTYQDAIELSYYGATVIHPKTLKPLQNKNIPLFVLSFLDPKAKGTIIHDVPSPLPTPCFIFKIKQVLISISPKDFSFIVEENLSQIFDVFSRHGVRINTMQNSAISFSICVDGNERRLPALIKALQQNYRVLYNEDLELVTIRDYNQQTIDRVIAGKNVLLEVKSRYTVQMVLRNK